MELDNAAINSLVALARAADGKIVEIGGKTYATDALHDPRKAEPVPETLTLWTLDSFVEYVKSAHDEKYRASRGQFVHVASPTVVRLHTGVFGEFNQRVKVVEAVAVVPTIQFDRWMDPESFNIALLCHFDASSTDRAAVQEIVGNLTSEAVQTVADDGVSQTATVRAGITRLSTQKVPSPVHLAPFRTFSEVKQVDSPFILRLRGGSKDTIPSCALFECDGGLWRLEAIARVKKYLADAIGESCAVYG